MGSKAESRAGVVLTRDLEIKIEPSESNHKVTNHTDEGPSDDVCNSIVVIDSSTSWDCSDDSLDYEDMDMKLEGMASDYDVWNFEDDVSSCASDEVANIDSLVDKPADCSNDSTNCPDVEVVSGGNIVNSLEHTERSLQSKDVSSEVKNDGNTLNIPELINTSEALAACQDVEAANDTNVVVSIEPTESNVQYEEQEMEVETNDSANQRTNKDKLTNQESVDSAGDTPDCAQMIKHRCGRCGEGFKRSKLFWAHLKTHPRGTLRDRSTSVDYSIDCSNDSTNCQDVEVVSGGNIVNGLEPTESNVQCEDISSEVKNDGNTLNIPEPINSSEAPAACQDVEAANDTNVVVSIEPTESNVQCEEQELEVETNDSANQRTNKDKLTNQESVDSADDTPDCAKMIKHRCGRCGEGFKRSKLFWAHLKTHPRGTLRDRSTSVDYSIDCSNDNTNCQDVEVVSGGNIVNSLEPTERSAHSKDVSSEVKNDGTTLNMPEPINTSEAPAACQDVEAANDTNVVVSIEPTESNLQCEEQEMEVETNDSANERTNKDKLTNQESVDSADDTPDCAKMIKHRCGRCGEGFKRSKLFWAHLKTHPRGTLRDRSTSVDYSIDCSNDSTNCQDVEVVSGGNIVNGLEPTERSAHSKDVEAAIDRNVVVSIEPTESNVQYEEQELEVETNDSANERTNKDKLTNQESVDSADDTPDCAKMVKHRCGRCGAGFKRSKLFWAHLKTHPRGTLRDRSTSVDYSLNHKRKCPSPPTGEANLACSGKDELTRDELGPAKELSLKQEQDSLRDRDLPLKRDFTVKRETYLNRRRRHNLAKEQELAVDAGLTPRRKLSLTKAPDKEQDVMKEQDLTLLRETRRMGLDVTREQKLTIVPVVTLKRELNLMNVSDKAQGGIKDLENDKMVVEEKYLTRRKRTKAKEPDLTVTFKTEPGLTKGQDLESNLAVVLGETYYTRRKRRPRAQDLTIEPGVTLKRELILTKGHDVTYISEQYVARSEKSGSSKTAKSYRCEICGKEFLWKCLLTRHLIGHQGIRPFRCTTCGKCYGRASHLRRHALIHTGAKPYQCKICGNRFTQKGHMQRHETDHKGEKPFRCPFCCLKFNRKGNLRRHQLTHTGEKQYKCKVCDREFALKYNLDDHEITHTLEKTRPCAICGRRFTRDRYLLRHESRLHCKGKPRAV